MITIRPMHFADLGFAAERTAAEGWVSESRAEFESFFTHDPNGCFIAEQAGKHIGIAVATHYRGSEAGFIGEIIVVPEARGQGVGRQLLDNCIAHLHHSGAKSLYLDGVVAAVSLYERAGFRRICRSLRFVGSPQGRLHPRVRAMRSEHLEAVCALDRAAFGADRSFFLKRRLSLYPELCKVLEENRQVIGFILGRRGQNLISAGPWVVRDGIEAPDDLLVALAAETVGIPVGIGVLETNEAAVSLLRAAGFTERLNPPWRMALGPSSDLGASVQCLAVGSAAKG